MPIHTDMVSTHRNGSIQVHLGEPEFTRVTNRRACYSATAAPWQRHDRSPTKAASLESPPLIILSSCSAEIEIRI